MGEQWQALAYVAADYGEFGLAREAIDLLVESFGGSAGANYRKANFLVDIGALAEGLALVCSMPQDAPDPFSHALTRGTLSATAGETAEAHKWLGRAIDLQPRSGFAWHRLAKAVDFEQHGNLYDRIVSIAETIGTAGANDFALFHYALGKAHADRGEHTRAFDAVVAAAQELKGDWPYDPDRARREALEAVTGYDAEAIAAIARQQSQATARAIFVLGSPRSGTTLVEQILTSHSAVHDGAEINLVRLLVQEVGGASAQALAGYVKKSGAAPLADLWQHWLDERFRNPGRIVDKTHLNSRNLGLIASLLPEAPLVWLQRDPLDCAWSCFRTGFLGSVPWTYELENIASHFRLEDELLCRWRQILGEKLLLVPYEALATEPEPWIRRILAHCDLSHELQAFAPHENPRVVSTSSAMQVRRPINRQGIGSAEPYRKFLEPFIQAYFG